ncbi:MAG: DUF192 domain-containing protein [Candidatus ainarchaeum sp.]|nr:DUF192 domain-containing protein [Candidatus ainarchaeum sp.]
MAGNKLIYAMAACGVLAAAFLLLTNDSHPGKEEITFTNGRGQAVPVYVEVADDMDELGRGLMFRESLPEDEGMLFVFPRPGNYAFWMKDTLVPLDAIYMDENSTVVGIVQMEPCIADPCPAYAPDSEALYVLEVNKGFSERHGIELGSRMTLK